MSGRAAAVDTLLVGALLAYGQAEVWNVSGGGAASLVGPQWANAAAYGIASLLLLARRRRPLAVLVGQSVVLTVEVLVFGASESLGALLPMLAGLYAVAAYGSRRASRLGAGAVAVWVFLHTLRDPALGGAGDLLGAAAFYLLLPLAWLFGDYARTRRLYLAELAERARREGAEQARRKVVEDRARVAREVHDIVAHGLAVMIRQAEAGDVRFDSDPARARGSFPVIADTGRHALGEVRRLTALLRSDEPPGGDGPGVSLREELQALVGQVRDAGLDVELHDEAVAGLPDDVARTACRIVQEALTNTLRHAGARHAEVTVRRGADELVAEVVDDGTAAPSAGPARDGGHGLVGMRERVAILHGEFVAGPRPDGGFLVRARLPLTGEERP